jgi:hypothetical protein
MKAFEQSTLATRKSGTLNKRTKATNMMKLDAQAIASPAQFKAALLVVRDKSLPDSHLAMLRAQGRAYDGKITATELARVAQYANYNAANLQYGTMALNVATALGFVPDKRADGSYRWWTTLSYAIEDQTEESTGHFQFIMRPELVTALREMKWA